jgi:hypothetical protein
MRQQSLTSEMRRFNRQMRLEQFEDRRCLSAIGFAEHAVEPAPLVRAVGDLNGDGHADLVGWTPQGIGWRENLDGRGSFGAVHRISGWRDYLSNMLVSDIDGDGDNDILAIQGAGRQSQLVWYENRNGRGDFWRQRVIGENELIWTLAAGDLDGDGDLDLVKSVIVPGGDSVLQIATHVDGLGTFETTQEFDLTTRIIQIYDIDQDGDQDIVTLAFSNLHALWLENTDGLGSFQPREIENITDFGSALVLDDLDHDGNVDLLVAGAVDVQRYEAQAGTVDFQFQNKSVLDLDIFDLWTGDFDGDGDRDVLFTTENTVRSLELNSDGGFLPAQVTEILGIYSVGHPIVDLNGDGRDDVVSARAWSEYSSGGTFDQFHSLDSVTGDTTDLRLADLDSDGDLDIITVAWDGSPCIPEPWAACLSTLSWNENLDGLGTFSPRCVIAQEEVAESMGGLAEAIDVDGDGDLDLVHAPSREAREVFWYENLDGNATFGPPQPTTEFRPLPLVGPFDVDLDADGDLDEVLFNRWTRTNEWNENLGDGNWQRWSTMPINRHIALGDIDGDGDLDYVTGSWETIWYENRPLGDANGDGRFTSSDLVAIMQSGKYEDNVPGNTSFAEGDWNGDGEFTSADLLLALQAGTYERLAANALSAGEPSERQIPAAEA